MLLTICESCGRKAPIKANNSPQYWYCKFCKAHLYPKKIQNLTLGALKDRVQREFPETTHYRAVEGQVNQGGPVIIDVPKVTEATKEIPARPKEKSLLLYIFMEGGEKKLGELFYD